MSSGIKCSNFPRNSGRDGRERETQEGGLKPPLQTTRLGTGGSASWTALGVLFRGTNCGGELFRLVKI